jgi:hypothetical protein
MGPKSVASAIAASDLGNCFFPLLSTLNQTPNNKQHTRNFHQFGLIASNHLMTLSFTNCSAISHDPKPALKFDWIEAS